MMQDLKEYLRCLWSKMWGRVAFTSSVIGVITKFAPVNYPWVASLVTWLMVAVFISGFFWANFQLFRERKAGEAAALERIGILQDVNAQELEYALINIQKVLEEVLLNLDQMGTFPQGLRDEAWRAFPVERLAMIPEELRQKLFTFYPSIRTLRDMAQDGAQFSVHRRDNLRASASTIAQELITQLNLLIRATKAQLLIKRQEAS